MATFMLLLATTAVGFSQDRDSIRTHVLEEVVFEVKTEGDTLQNFYRANTSATTENILSRMRGVSLIRRGAYGQEPVFRALSGGQVNITIDGMKIFGACTDKMDPVTIYVEPQNLSSIQVMSGTLGSQFGSTIGGAFNMKLAQPSVKEPGIKAQAGIDFQSAARALNYFSSVNLGTLKNAYRSSVSYRNSHNYRAGGGKIIAYSQYTKINIATAAKWTLSKHDTLHADILYDRGWDIGFPALPMDVARATAGLFAVSYHRAAPWLVFHHLTAKVYHNQIAHMMDDTHRKNTSMHMDMPGKSKTTGIFAEGDIHLFHDHETTFKTEYFTNTLIGEMTMYSPEGLPMHMQTAPESRRQNAGLFLQQKVRIGDENKLLFSFRGDLIHDHIQAGIGRQQWEVFNLDRKALGHRFAKTLSMLFTRALSGNLKMELQSGYGERVPTLNERYGFYLFNRFDGYDYIGNPALENESSYNIEGTLSYFGNKIEWQVTPFIQRIEHYIIGLRNQSFSPMTPGATGVKQNTNISYANLKGFDVMILASPAPSLQAISTVKYTYGSTSLQEPMPLIPPLKAVTSLRYAFKDANVQAEWEYATQKKHVSKSTGEHKTSGYGIISLRAGWKVNASWSGNVGIENIFDKNYREHLDWGGIPRPGRNLYINILYKLL